MTPVRFAQNPPEIGSRAPGIPLAVSDVVLSRRHAVRYQLSARVLYRPAGQEQWSEGITLDVSPSGVLIRGDLPDACAEPVAVVIALPTSSGSLTGCGRIVRVAEIRPSGPGIFAIAIPRFALEHLSVARPPLDSLHQEC